MRWLLALMTCAFVTNVHADEITEEESAVQIHGFISQGALLSSDNNYLAYSERGSLEFTEAGIALTKQLDSRLRVGFQLFARDLGPMGNYSAKFDWFNLDYRWRDWLGVRAGRTKLPFGLYNDTVDVDAAHAVVILPQSVYSMTNRDFLLAQTGIELYGYRTLGRAGALDYRFYFGTFYFTAPDTQALEVLEIEVPYLAGGRVMWETPAPGLRVGASVLSGEITGEFIQFGLPTSLVTNQDLIVGSLEYTADALVFSAEYGRAYADSTITVAGAPMPSKLQTQAFYLMASYRLANWLQPATYYSVHYPAVENPGVGRDGRQHDAAVTLRFDITPNWILKLEGHSMRGAASVQPSLNVGETLVNRWYLAAAKTTVYF